MYHIAHITPIQEESEVLDKFRSYVEWSGRETYVDRVNTITEIKMMLRKQRFQIFFVSTRYEPRELFKRITFLAEFCRSQKLIVPLVYELDWDFPLPCILGTRWGGHVGIVHNFNSRSEVMTMLQRFNGLGADPDLFGRRRFRSPKRERPF